MFDVHAASLHSIRQHVPPRLEHGLRLPQLVQKIIKLELAVEYDLLTDAVITPSSYASLLYAFAFMSCQCEATRSEALKQANFTF